MSDTLVLSGRPWGRITMIEEDTRQRGVLLGGWLIFLALVYVCLAGIDSTALLSRTLSAAGLPGRAALASIVMAILSFVGFVALWFWRKAGFYICVITCIPLVLINLITGDSLLLALFPVYCLSTLWGLLQPRWRYFY